MDTNRAVSYQELSYMDCTPLLAQFIFDLINRGDTFQRDAVTVRKVMANQPFSDPVTQRSITLPRDGVYSYTAEKEIIGGGANPWQIMGRHEDLGSISIYLAEHTPRNDRYLAMIEVMDALSKPAVPVSYSPGATFGR